MTQINIPSVPADLDAMVLDRAVLESAEAAAQLVVGLQSQVRIVDADTDRDFELDDAGALVVSREAGAVTLTIPEDATLNFPIGSTIALWQLGTGTLVVDSEAGVTLIAASGDTLAQGLSAVAVKTAADEWALTGDLV
jgi:hypothetical protein